MSLATLDAEGPELSFGAWSRSDDIKLSLCRAHGLSWEQIKARYFPTKSSNACRTRHELLMNLKDWGTLITAISSLEPKVADAVSGAITLRRPSPPATTITSAKFIGAKSDVFDSKTNYQVGFKVDPIHNCRVEGCPRAGLENCFTHKFSLIPIPTFLRRVNRFIVTSDPHTIPFVLPNKEYKVSTDSAYAFMPSFSFAVTPLDQNRQTLADNAQQEVSSEKEDNDEASRICTVDYSTVTLYTQRSIDWICDDIYDNVQAVADNLGYHMMEGRLPGLLGEFADKLGPELPDPLGSQIMLFIHKHLSHIILHLGARFTNKANDPSVESGKDEIEESISAEDDVQRRGRIWEEGDQGSDNDNENGWQTEGLEFSSHKDAILSSTAYKGLLTDFAKQLSLNWGTSQAKTLVNEIRKDILKRLPAGVICRNLSLPTFSVSFRLPWEPIQTRLKQERWSLTGKFRLPSLQSLMTLTCTVDDEIQLNTVGQYFKQTWPDDAAVILEHIQTLFDKTAGGLPLPVAQHDKTGTGLSLEGPDLVITVSGPAYFIAQCGAQLSWLGSAVQSLDKGFKFYTPYTTVTGELEFSIEARPDFLVNGTRLRPLLATPLELLHSRLSSSCPVRGFPTARRPEGFPGLEVSWVALLTIAQKTTLDPVPSYFNGRRLLLGLHTTLQLVKALNEIVLWHIVESPSTGCLCSMGCLEPREYDKLQSVTFQDLTLRRHVISMCEREQASLALDLSNTPNLTDAVLDLSEERWQHKSLEPNQEGLPHTSLTFESPESASFDSDMLSISSFSQEVQTGPLNEDDELTPIVIKVLDRLLADFYTSLKPICTPSDGRCSSSNTGGSSNCGTGGPFATRETASGSGPVRRRLLPQQDTEDFEEDDLQKPPKKRQKQPQETPQQKNFACPFWTSSPVQHRGCFSHSLTTVSRVKQHLFRKHVIKFYCQRCMSIFETSEEHSSHVMQPPLSMCTPNPGASLDGISPEQGRELSRKSKQKGISDADKWFEIWEMLFPGRSRPNSPYIDAQLTAGCAMFQEYVVLAGPDLIVQAVESSSAISMSHATEDGRREVLRRVISAGLRSLVDDWSYSRERRLNATQTGVSPSDEGGDDSGSRAIPSVTTVNSATNSSAVIFSRVSEDSSSRLPCLLENQSTSRPRMPVDEEVKGTEDRITSEVVQHGATVNHESSINPPNTASPTRESQETISTGDLCFTDFSSFNDIDLESFTPTEFQPELWPDSLDFWKLSGME